MIELIAHRGYWNDAVEKNTMAAFSRALENGFGIETDFRDLNAELVISHDMPTTGAMKASQLSDLYQRYPVSAPIALNIKSDGLHDLVNEFIRSGSFKNFFVFDMAVPDMRSYFKKHIPVFARVSEYESHPAFFDMSFGIWLDAFENEWYGADTIDQLLKQKKHVAIVSPELHGRPHEDLWALIKRNNYHRNSSVSICTDFPMQAKEYFHG
jgi:glycerophosphoryl diester phosphodiesterase